MLSLRLGWLRGLEGGVEEGIEAVLDRVERGNGIADEVDEEGEDAGLGSDDGAVVVDNKEAINGGGNGLDDKGGGALAKDMGEGVDDKWETEMVDMGSNRVLSRLRGILRTANDGMRALTRSFSTAQGTSLANFLHSNARMRFSPT
ncbi:hypothetical protein ACLOJK_019412 [Asimina triloba]